MTQKETPHISGARVEGENFRQALANRGRQVLMSTCEETEVLSGEIIQLSMPIQGVNTTFLPRRSFQSGPASCVNNKAQSETSTITTEIAIRPLEGGINSVQVACKGAVLPTGIQLVADYWIACKWIMGRATNSPLMSSIASGKGSTWK